MHHLDPMRTILATILAVATGIALLSSPASAEPDYFGNSDADEIKIRLDRPRSTTERIVIGALLGGALVVGGLGVGFHLDSRAIADELAADGPTGLVYTQELEDRRRSGVRSGHLASASYTVGGLLLIGSLAALIITQPESEVLTVDGQPDKTPVTLVPMPGGGAIVGATWSF